MAVVFLASRVLCGLAEEGQAPRIFLKTNRFGAPYPAVIVSSLFMPLVYLSLGSNSSAAFGWFVNIATVAALIAWLIIEITFLRFFYALKVQGIARERKRKTYLSGISLMNGRSTIQVPSATIHGLDNYACTRFDHSVLGV